jgi:regulatory protein
MDEDLTILLGKARSYCAYRERCLSEVKDKLRDWGAGERAREKILEMLVNENYVDEARFARIFAGSKFRNNRWGKTKITYELRMRGIGDALIASALEEIGEEDSEQALIDLLKKKSKEIREPDPFRKKQKLIAFAVRKGFTFDQARQAANRIDA